jgi:mRNA interferase RelE/StbE
MNRRYLVGFKPEALHDLRGLDRGIAERILAKILWLARHVNVIQHEAMAGNWIGFYRYRIGDYRVFYRLIEEETLLIVEHVGHRRKVYDE